MLCYHSAIGINPYSAHPASCPLKCVSLETLKRNGAERTGGGAGIPSSLRPSAFERGREGGCTQGVRLHPGGHAACWRIHVGVHPHQAGLVLSSAQILARQIHAALNPDAEESRRSDRAPRSHTRRLKMAETEATSSPPGWRRLGEQPELLPNHFGFSAPVDWPFGGTARRPTWADLTGRGPRRNWNTGPAPSTETGPSGRQQPRGEWR